MYLHHPSDQRRRGRWRRAARSGACELINGSFSFFLTLPERPPDRSGRWAVARSTTSAATRSACRAGSPAMSPSTCRGVRAVRRARRGPRPSSASCASPAVCSRSSTAGSPRRTASGSRSSATEASLFLDAPVPARTRRDRRRSLDPAARPPRDAARGCVCRPVPRGGRRSHECRPRRSRAGRQPRVQSGRHRDARGARRGRPARGADSGRRRAPMSGIQPEGESARLKGRSARPRARSPSHDA